MKAIVDCNSFYCSCEKVFQPGLEHKPVVVLSNNDGCIISRSDEAKAIGVGMAGPYFKARPLIEKYKVAVFSSNYNLYGDMSWRVMEILKQMAGEENLEVYSVDEAFLDLEDLSTIQLHELACEMRDRIYNWTGIRVSIGIAPTKTLSKLANRFAKDNKAGTQCISILDTEEKIIKALKKTGVGDVWGIGSRYADKLRNLGIPTAWDLSRLTEEWARTNLGGVVGVRLIKELNGKDAFMMKEELVTKKMIATTRMFGNALTDLRDIKEAVATYAARAAEKLRRQKSAANIISILLVSQEKIDSPHFKHGPTESTYLVLPRATSMSNELIKPALQLTEQLFRPGKKYKKAGVILSGLVPDDAIQANIFQPGESIGRFLMEMVDNINFSMRDDLVKFASSGTRREWKMRTAFHSPRYTTRWEELAGVK
jgi:DNA polymerase V